MEPSMPEDFSIAKTDMKWPDLVFNQLNRAFYLRTFVRSSLSYEERLRALNTAEDAIRPVESAFSQYAQEDEEGKDKKENDKKKPTTADMMSAEEESVLKATMSDAEIFEIKQKRLKEVALDDRLRSIDKRMDNIFKHLLSLKQMPEKSESSTLKGVGDGKAGKV